MIKSNIQPAPTTFWVQRADGRVQLTYQQVFAAGHKLWLNGKYPEATEVFRQLVAVRDRGPRAHILLAHCKAMTGDYSGCSRILAEALESDHYGNAASDLHIAFVMWKCTLFVDAKDELQKVVTAQTDLPTPCLLLADLLMTSGNCEKPPRLLKQAISRDRPDGAIATIARRELTIALKMAETQSGRHSSKPLVRKSS
jgi:thioredoxin-like negative regulator of GroEL